MHLSHVITAIPSNIAVIFLSIRKPNPPNKIIPNSPHHFYNPPNPMETTELTTSPSTPKPLKPPAYCWDCNYNLAHLTSNACPECGRPFDPSDYRSYNEYNPHRERRYTFKLFTIIFVGSFFLTFPILSTIVNLIAFPTAYELAQKAYNDPNYNLRYFAFIAPLLIALFATRDILWLAFLLI